MVDDDRASLFSHTILYMYNHFGQIRLIIVTLNSGQAYICRPIYHAYFFWAAQTHPLFCEWTKSNPCYTSYHLMPSSIILAHSPNSPAFILLLTKQTECLILFWAKSGSATTSLFCHPNLGTHVPAPLLPDLREQHKLSLNDMDSSLSILIFTLQWLPSPLKIHEFRINMHLLLLPTPVTSPNAKI